LPELTEERNALLGPRGTLRWGWMSTAITLTFCSLSSINPTYKT